MIFLPLAVGPLAARPDGSWSAGASTSLYVGARGRRARRRRSARRSGREPRAGRPGRSGHGAAGILGRRSTVAASARPRRHPHRSRRRHADREEAPTAPPPSRRRPAAASARRSRLLLRGRLRPDARREGQHHDPRVHVRDGGLRGDPGVLERRRGAALRAEDPRARRADPAERPDAAHGARCRASTSSIGLVVETVRRNGFREDVYIRPSFYKSSRRSASGSTTSSTSSTSSACRSANYIDTETGVRVMTSSWRRNADEAIPARGKIVGGYVNMAFQKSEAELNGFDEALVMTAGRPRVGGLGGEPVRGPRRRAHHARRSPTTSSRASPARRSSSWRRRGHPGRGPLDRPLRALRRGRDVPVRDGRPGVAGRRDRPPHRWAPARSARSARLHPRPLLRRGPRSARRVPPLADADPRRATDRRRAEAPLGRPSARAPVRVAGGG